MQSSTITDGYDGETMTQGESFTPGMEPLVKMLEADERVIDAAVALVAEWRAKRRNPTHELAQELIAAVEVREKVAP